MTLPKPNSYFSLLLQLSILTFLSSHPKSCQGQVVSLTAEYLDVKLPTPLYRHKAFYDGDDSIYLFGGFTPSASNQVLRFSISMETVKEMIPLPAQAFHGTLEADDAGYIYYFGGGPSYNQIFRYNPTLNESSVLLTLPYRGNGLLSVRLNASTVLLLGGVDAPNELWSFDMETGLSVRLGFLPFSLNGGTGVLVNGNKAFLFDDSRTNNRQALEFDLETLNITAVGPSTLPNFWDTASSVSDSYFVYIIGGYQTDDRVPTDGIIRFDPLTLQNVFIPVTNFAADYAWYWFNAPASVYVPSLNRIYCFGGSLRNLASNQYIDQDGIFYMDLSPLGPPPTTTEEPGTTFDPELFSCVGQIDGMYPHPTDCAKYFGCRDEEVIGIFTCSPPLLFDPVTKTCNFPDLVNCDPGKNYAN